MVQWRAVTRLCTYGLTNVVAGMSALHTVVCGGRLVSREALRRQSISSNCSSYTIRPKTTVAVLGGAFDPPTNGHLQLATEIVQTNGVDEV